MEICGSKQLSDEAFITQFFLKNFERKLNEKLLDMKNETKKCLEELTKNGSKINSAEYVKYTTKPLKK